MPNPPPWNDPALNFNNVNISWPLGGDPTITWSASEVEGVSIDIWHSNTSSFGSATLLTSLGGGATSFTDTGRAKDGAANYYWPVNNGPNPNLKGGGNGVQGCQNSFGPVACDWPNGANMGVNTLIPFTTDFAGGTAISFGSITVATFTPGGPFPIDNGTGLLFGTAGTPGSIEWLQFGGDGSIVGTTTEGPLTFDLNNLITVLTGPTGYTPDFDGTWGNPPNTDSATGSVSGELTYMSQQGGAMQDGSGGWGGGFGPPPGAPILNGPGSGENTPASVPLPCIPCCNSCCAMPCKPGSYQL